MVGTGSISAPIESVGRDRRSGGDAPDAGFSMISIVLSLVGVALLTLGLLSTTLHSGSTADTSVSNAPGVGLADDLVAQQSLSTALTTVSTAASTSGGYGSVDIATLSASDPSVTYVDGPTTSASTVSITVTSGSGGAGGGGGSAIGAAISGAVAAGAGSSDGAGLGGGGGVSGTVTLAARSSDGVCWLVWKGQGSGSWYGAQTGLASCTAPALSSAPSPGPVSSSGIGWQEGSFPAA
jgi:hypothetical protein